MRVRFLLLLAAAFSLRAFSGELEERIRLAVQTDYPHLEALYKDLHRNPELSLLEGETASRFAGELRQAGFEVTERVGGFGVVGLLRNGGGPVLMLRTDLDALPVKEQTGLPYASHRSQTNTAGQLVSVMHACGHDIHMTVMAGVARFFARNTNLFKGTLMIIGQPAEERGAGARAMLKDGLFERFPKPNYALAFHVHSTLEAGKIAYVPGYILANVDSIDVTIRGVGGHGAYPHGAKDPIVLAAETIMALQTLISREKPATEPGVLTVGSIHGGTKHNIIPDEVKLQLTLRTYSDSVRSNMIAGIQRVTRGLALAAGMPEDGLPLVKVDESEFTPAAYNDPGLTERIKTVFADFIGTSAVIKEQAQMGGEDFGLYGRTGDHIPISMFWLGSISPDRLQLPSPPSIHSPFYYPDPEPTIRTGVGAMAAAVIDILKR